MKFEDDKPVVGCGSDMLGVRIDCDDPDITPDGEQMVHRCGDGLSVYSCLCTIPPSRVPKSLKGIVIGARGSLNRHIWRFGNGLFTEGQLCEGLSLKPDEPINKPQHGVVQPDRAMHIDAFQQYLADTQNDWIVDEVLNEACLHD